MARSVAIDEIVTDRTIIPGDDLIALKDSIDKTGLQVPILVTQDLELIDGLRRLEALRSLGAKDIEAVITYMYPVACDAIEAAVKHGLHAAPLTGERIWEIYNKMYPLLFITRSFNQRGRYKGAKLKSAGGRPLLAQALGMKSQSMLQAITQVHRSLEVPETATKAAEAIKLIKEGQLTYYAAIDYIKKPPGLSGDIVALAGQREALDSSATSLNAVVRALGRLGPLHKKLSKEEVETKIAELAYARAKLTKTIKLLTKEINER